MEKVIKQFLKEQGAGSVLHEMYESNNYCIEVRGTIVKFIEKRDLFDELKRIENDIAEKELKKEIFHRLGPIFNLPRIEGDQNSVQSN